MISPFIGGLAIGYIIGVVFMGIITLALLTAPYMDEQGNEVEPIDIPVHHNNRCVIIPIVRPDNIGVDADDLLE